MDALRLLAQKKKEEAKAVAGDNKFVKRRRDHPHVVMAHQLRSSTLFRRFAPANSKPPFKTILYVFVCQYALPVTPSCSSAAR